MLDQHILRSLKTLGTVSKMKLLRLGISRDTIRTLEKRGFLTKVEHPMKIQFKVSDSLNLE